LDLEGDVVDSRVARVPLRKPFNCDHVFLFLDARCTTFSNRPKQIQFIKREASCYELRRVRVNPCFKKPSYLHDRSQWLPVCSGSLLKLFSELGKLAL